MIQITKLSDLSRAVALALHPEPPLSERRAIHPSGCWRWVGVKSNPYNAEYSSSYWEPADFATCPLASKLLRDRMRADGWRYCLFAVDAFITRVWRNTGQMETLEAFGETEESSIALAFLRALGVEFELVAGWDAK